MRLINADGLIDDFMKIAITRSLTHKKDRMTFTKIKETINQQPPVDAKPIVRGEWKHFGEKDWLRDNGQPVFINCSKCNNYVLNNASTNWNYCPNCGADMRGGTDDN